MAAGKSTDTAAVVRGGQLQGEAPATARPVESAPPMRRSVQLAAQRPTRSMVPILMVGISAVIAIVLYVVFSQSSDSGAGTTTPGPTAPAATAGTPAAGETTQNKPPSSPPSPSSPPNPPAAATEPTAKNPSAPGTVDMTLVTTPPGATVAIDGIVQTGVTPLPLKGLPQNKSLQLVMTLAGYKPYTARVPAQAGNFPVTLEKGSSSTPRPNPNAPIMKFVEVNTIPVGADVFLEGKKVGKTPTRFKVPDLSRPLHLEVRRSGFHHQERTITSFDTFVPKGNDDVLELSYQLVSNLVPDKKPTGQTPPPQENKPPGAPKPEGQPAATTPPPAEEKPKPKEAEKPAAAGKPETPPPPSPSAERAAPATP